MRTKLLLLLLLANFSISTYGQRNLLSNGDFEAWPESKLDQWYSFYFNISQSTFAQSGLYSAKMLLVRPEIFTGNTYCPVQVNKTYRITMYHRVISGSVSSISVRLFDPKNNELIRKDDLTSSSSEWRKIEFEYINTVTDDFQIQIFASGVLNSEILIDNVSVVDIDEDLLKTVLIPDINFEKKLISLGIDSGIPDGKVLNINVDTIRELDLRDSSISDLTGIEAFINLRSLDASRNNVTDINLSQNKKIYNLKIDNNKLTNLDLSSNIKLTDFRANYNELYEINLKKNLGLATLQVYDNKLTNLDISTNSELRFLTCDSNKLTKLDISNNTLLQFLEVSNNHLTTLDVTTHPYLTTLICDNNELTNLNITNNNMLEDLSCEANFLNTINIKNNPKLGYLNINTNNLTDIDISQNQKLDLFYCSKNQIKNLDLSQNTLLSRFTCMGNKLLSLDVSHNLNLTRIKCSDNQINSIDISKNSQINELFCENNQLTYLNLRNGNNINLRSALQYSSFKNNPNLTCILVDDVAHSNANWTALKDATTSYSATCTLGLETSVFDKVALFPNPTKGDVTITNLSLNKATVYNSTGQLIKSFALDTANTNNTISLSGLPKGIYYVYLINQDAASAKKVIVE